MIYRDRCLLLALACQARFECQVRNQARLLRLVGCRDEEFINTHARAEALLHAYEEAAVENLRHHNPLGESTTVRISVVDPRFVARGRAKVTTGGAA